MATNAKLIYPELSYKLLGLLFKVHSKLGSSYQEKYYQRAIEQELTLQKIPFQREVPIDVEYSGIKLGKHFLDFVFKISQPSPGNGSQLPYPKANLPADYKSPHRFVDISLN